MQKVSCCDRPLQPRFVLATDQLLVERGHSYRIFGNRHLKVNFGPAAVLFSDTGDLKIPIVWMEISEAEFSAVEAF